MHYHLSRKFRIEGRYRSLAPVVCLVCILMLAALPHITVAQVPATLWSRTFGGSNIDIGHDVQQTRDGGFIVTGYTRSYGTMSGRNVWLLKVNAAGNQEWNRAIGGNADEEGHAVQQTIDGGYLIAGFTRSFGAGLNDVYLIKTDTGGNTQWSWTFGGAQDDEAYDVLETTDGGYLIAGVTSSFAAGGRDVWLIKTDAAGIEQWRRSLGALSSDGARSIRPTSDGGYILTGWTFSYGPGALGNAWLVKTDNAGNIVWHRAFGGTDADRGYSVQQTTDGGYILAGYTASIGAGLDDMLLIKTDSAGNDQWTRTFGGSGRDYGHSVQQTTDGGYIVAGYTLSSGAGGDDFWLVKTDGNGNLVWSSTYGGSSSDVAYAVRQTDDGGYIATGHTLSSGSGVHDVWLLRLATDPTSITIPPELPGRARLHQNYPNPFNPGTNIAFEIHAAGWTSLKVYDLLGREVATLVNEEKAPGEYTARWDARDLAGGVYVYRLRTGSFTETKKLLLLR